VETAEQSVKDMYALRQRVGVEAFNSPRGRYLQDSVDLWAELKAKQKGVEDILNLYEHYQRQLNVEQQESMDAKQLRALDAAIARIEKRVSTATVERLRAAADIEYAEPMPSSRRFWAQYDDEWTVLRDSAHSIWTMNDIAEQRQLMRCCEMLVHRASLLREAGLIDEAEEQRLKQARTEEMERIIEDDDGAEELDSPRKKKPKLEAHGAAAADEHDALDEGAAADAAAAAVPEPSAALRRFESDWDQARNVDALHEAAVLRLRKDVAVATAKAHAEHATVQFIKRRVHLTTEEAARILQRPCTICNQELTDPCFARPHLRRSLSRTLASGEILLPDLLR